jgi:hypothetical protein
MKDLGEANVILNIKLAKDGGVILSQSHYVEKILICFGYDLSQLLMMPA